MKYLSLILIVLAMKCSWALVNAGPQVAETVHIGIQEDLKRVISEYIQQNLPNSKDLQFEKFYTETVSAKQVRANFIYSFIDEVENNGPTRVEIDGYAILNKMVKETADSEYWSFDELYILNNKIEFKEGIEITPDTAETEE